MINLRERTEMVNGLLNIQSQHGRGTLVQSMFRSQKKQQTACITPNDRASCRPQLACTICIREELRDRRLFYCFMAAAVPT